MLLEELKVLLGEVIAVGVVGLAAYMILKKDAQTYLPTAAQVGDGLKSIVTQGPSALVDTLKGNDGSNYITTDQQRANAQANLARVLAARGATAAAN